MHIYTYIQTYIHAYIHTHISVIHTQYTHIHMCTEMYTCHAMLKNNPKKNEPSRMLSHSHIHTHKLMYVEISVCTYMCVFPCIQAHAYTLTRRSRWASLLGKCAKEVCLLRICRPYFQCYSCYLILHVILQLICLFLHLGLPLVHPAHSDDLVMMGVVQCDAFMNDMLDVEGDILFMVCGWLTLMHVTCKHVFSPFQCVFQLIKQPLGLVLLLEK
jgi:hypothetical protein